MKHRTGSVIVLLAILMALPFAAHASSIQAYQDYQFQFGQYRARAGEFQIAKNEYDQFHSLAAEQALLDKTRLLLAQRDTVAKTYFLFLNEKLTENPGMLSQDRALYRTLITSRIGFLDQNAVMAPSAASRDDAERIAKDFDDQYEVMQAAYRQTIVGIQLGYLTYFAGRFDSQVIKAQALIAARKSDASPEKMAVLDRWLLQLSNKHVLFEQKAREIRAIIPKITGNDIAQDRMLTDVQQLVTAARLDLVESASYLRELENALKYE